jgi:membrane-bound lytic murein transglycosylase D
MSLLKPSTLLLCAAILLCGCDPGGKPVHSSAGSTGQQTAPPLTAAGASSARTGAAGQSSASSPAQAADQDLIDRVEKAYSSGVNAYRAGNLAEAKADFDRSVDLMLSSGRDLRNDAVLAAEFERIVDAVNSLEMAALKQGNGFAPRTEESPSDVANEVTFPVDPNVTAQARAELATTVSDLPLVINDYVSSYINFFANSQRGHATLAHAFARAGRYRALIQKVLREEGVPQDLIYQAVAESGFQPQAVNPRSGAGGMWQFMPSGPYGLERNGYLDERFDPQKSTRAYAVYIKQLYQQLGDWYLAMAAYDWGAGNVQRAVERTGYADFWELYRRNNLPLETKNYVPQILAAIIIAKNARQYGFEDVMPDAPLLTDTVTVHGSVNLRLVADLVEAPLEEIAALNPALLRLLTPPDADYDLHLPAGAGELYRSRIGQIPEDKRRYWRYHKVLAGETLDSIARSYHVAADDLAATNALEPGDDLSGVEALVVPVAPAAAPALARRSTYTVRRGDTIVTIADRFGVTVAQLRTWNRIRGNSVAAGRRLQVAEPAHVARARHSASSSPGRSAGAGKKSSPSHPSSGARKARSSAAGRAAAQRNRH